MHTYEHIFRINLFCKNKQNKNMNQKTIFLNVHFGIMLYRLTIIKQYFNFKLFMNMDNWSKSGILMGFCIGTIGMYNIVQYVQQQFM